MEEERDGGFRDIAGVGKNFHRGFRYLDKDFRIPFFMGEIIGKPDDIGISSGASFIT